MIFPTQLEYVTFFLPIRNEYHEIRVSASQSRFSMEAFHAREALSGKRMTAINGLRFDVSINLDRTTQHAAIRSFLNALADEISQGGESVDVFLKAQSSIAGGEDGIEVGPEAMQAMLGHMNQISRHGYDLKFYGQFVLPEIAEGVIFFFIFENGDFVIDLNGDNFISELSVG